MLLPLAILPHLFAAQTASQNYILSRRPLNTAGTAAIETVTYVDGLGRPVETVQKGAAPDGGFVSYANGDASKPSFHYYIKDHLGSNRIVLADDGTVEQVNDYYPFGALMSNGWTNASSQRYKYIGKELDRTFGYDMYDNGARWNNSLLGRWETMDKLAEKSYEVSPYAVCKDNPQNRIDVNGLDDYKLSRNGTLKFWRKTNAKSTDRIYSEKENITVGKTIVGQMLANKPNYNGTYAVGSKNEIMNLFYFVANNSNVEWGLSGFHTKDGDKFLLRTTYSEGDVSMTYGPFRMLDLFVDVHSHPGNSPAKASGFGKNSEQNGKLYSAGGDDQFTANNIFNSFKAANKSWPNGYPRFFIYHIKSQRLIAYNSDSPKISTSIVRNMYDLVK